MAPNVDRFRPWWGRRIRPAMKQLVVYLDEADGPVDRESIRGRIHGGLLPPAVRRGLIERSDGVLTLTERGRLVARDQIPEVPEEHRMICACGLVVDDRDAAQVDYLRRHQEGDPETRVCPLTRKESAP